MAPMRRCSGTAAGGRTGAEVLAVSLEQALVAPGLERSTPLKLGGNSGAEVVESFLKTVVAEQGGRPAAELESGPAVFAWFNLPLFGGREAESVRCAFAGGASRRRPSSSPEREIIMKTLRSAVTFLLGFGGNSSKFLRLSSGSPIVKKGRVEIVPEENRTAWLATFCVSHF
ncbi:hypothetical protein AAES_52018 [Amazona aestiva]|uniref:Uncharacterized protein n=1 Tax=Amazona aestiva TaxID=12930 RepID=A0A0Q3Q745_AMAAE|nr:hypothetical protein AAES_52018 [Amazona aestiva]